MGGRGGFPSISEGQEPMYRAGTVGSSSAS